MRVFVCSRITVQHFGWRSQKPNVDVEHTHMECMAVNGKAANMVNALSRQRGRKGKRMKERIVGKYTEWEREYEESVSAREMHLSIFIWTMTILSLKYTISCMCKLHTYSACQSIVSRLMFRSERFFSSLILSVLLFHFVWLSVAVLLVDSYAYTIATYYSDRMHTVQMWENFNIVWC